MATTRAMQANLGQRGRAVGRHRSAVKHTVHVKAANEQQEASTTEGIASPPYGQVTVEFQREKAKELVQFLREQRNQELAQESQVFGWTRRNEIGNGRWVMFGLLVGLLVRSCESKHLHN